jgi:hypothetical protein
LEQRKPRRPAGAGDASNFGSSRKVFGRTRAGCGVAGRNRTGSGLGAALDADRAGRRRGIETQSPHAVTKPKWVGLASGSEAPGERVSPLIAASTLPVAWQPLGVARSAHCRLNIAGGPTTPQGCQARSSLSQCCQRLGNPTGLPSQLVTVSTLPAAW